MMSLTRRTLQRLMRESRGAEIAEAAAVLPVMFMILLGIFWFGQAFSIYGAITRAAQEGARAGAVPYCATCTGTNSLPQYVSNATTAVQNSLTVANLNPALIQPPSPVPPFVSCAQLSTNCQGGVVCVQMPVLLTTSGSAGAGACGISVSFRYPFQFWLPFTSVNNQLIYLPASARVRVEMR